MIKSIRLSILDEVWGLILLKFSDKAYTQLLIKCIDSKSSWRNPISNHHAKVLIHEKNFDYGTDHNSELYKLITSNHGTEKIPFKDGYISCHTINKLTELLNE